MNERLLVVTQWYPKNQDDRQRTWAIATIVEGLRAHGVETVVVVPREETRSISCATVNQQPVYSVPEILNTDLVRSTFPSVGRYLRRVLGLFLTLKIRPMHFRMRRLKKLTDEFLAGLGDFDTLILHGRPNRHMKLLHGHWSGPISVVFHQSDVQGEDTASFFREYGGRVKNVGFRSEVLHQKFVANGWFSKERPYHLVHSGVARDQILSRQAYRSRTPGTTLRLLTVSSLIPRKNIHNLLQVLADCEDMGCTLDVIGRGPELENLVALAAKLGVSERVVFHGFVPHERVMQTYGDYDVFVLLSERETFGMVYTEALSQGLFVIGSDGEGIDSVIVDSVNGFLVDPAKPEELAGVLRKIAHLSPEEEGIFKDRVYQTISDLTNEKIAAEYYQKLCNTL